MNDQTVIGSPIVGTSVMVERVAQAICESHGRVWKALAPFAKDWWRVEARAAIEAMREPTPDMVAAGEGYNFADVAWESMIDAALSAAKGEA